LRTQSVRDDLSSVGDSSTAEVHPLLEVQGLRKEFRSIGLLDRLTHRPRANTLALDDVSLSIAAGETVGIVGESGSGKSTLARSLVRLVEPDAGTIRFMGEDIGRLHGAELALLRRRMQLIYQDPYTSLNPVLTIGAAIAEPALVHGLVKKANAEQRVADLMSQVGLSPGLRDRHPAALSGGQRQRVAIARSLAAEPRMLIADEAVSALDVSIQAQILHLFARLQRELGLTMIFVSHQLATVAQLCQRVLIMYRGQIVEAGPTAEVFARPRHGYTAALLEAHPGKGRLQANSINPDIRGALPSTTRVVEQPRDRRSGCLFHDRCQFAISTCHTETPTSIAIAVDHVASCPVLAAAGERPAPVTQS